MVTKNLAEIQRRIAEVCRSCGRQPEQITLVAVSKTFSSERIREAVDAGLVNLGENYVQELTEKRRHLGELPIRWHFIGHLQTNKVKYIIDFVDLIHSIDNDRVAVEIQKRAERNDRVASVLIEVHTTTEATKHGVDPKETSTLIKKVAALERVKVMGLMTMGPYSENPQDSRDSFRIVSNLRKQIEEEGMQGVSMQELSMGMSHDYSVAIEEGATILRLGTAIFGERR